MSDPVKGSSIAAIVVAGLFGLAGIGAAVAMVMTGDARPAGRETARAAVEAAVEAWRAGDGDRVVALMPSYGELAQALDCPRVDEEDARERHTQLRMETWAKARVWKHRRPRLRTVEPGEVRSHGIDEAVGRCRTNQPLSIQQQDITVELDGGGHGQHEVTIAVVELGGRWFVMDTGEVPSSEESEYERLLDERRERMLRARQERDDRDALQRYSDERRDRLRSAEDAEDTSLWAAVGGLESRRVRRMRQAQLDMCACKDVACVERVQRDVDRLVGKLDLDDDRDFDDDDDEDKLSESDRTLMSRLSREAAACRTAVRRQFAPRSGIAECDQYIEITEWYMECDAIPQAARDGMKQGMDAMQQAWADNQNLPDEARSAMADGCRAAVDAIKQSAAAMGCGTPP